MEFILRIKEFIRLIFGKYPKLILDVNYDEYWDDKRNGCLGELNSFQKNRASVILKIIDDNSSIKDLGCGDGAILKFILKNKTNIRCLGADVSEHVLSSLAKYDISPLQLNLNDGEAVRCLELTDYTLMLEVLEHISNPESLLLAVLENTSRKVIFSIPNSGFIAHRLRLLFGSFPLQWRLNPSEHLRFWTAADLIWWLNELRLSKQSEVIYYEGIPILNKLFPKLFAMGIIVTIDMSSKEFSDYE